MTAFFLAGHAFAGVGNPAYYDIDVTEGAFIDVSSGTQRIGDFAGALSGDIDMNGDYVYDDDTISSGPTSDADYNHIVQINPTGTSGFLDPSTGEFTLTLNLRIKFLQGAGPSVPAGCQTSYFTVTASTRKSATWASPSDFEGSFGSFVVVAEDFTIPAVTTGACGATHAGNINAAFSLGTGSGAHTFYMQGKIDNPQIPTP